MKTHVAFLIRRLDRGGAERQLIRARPQSQQAERFDVTILTFYGGGGFASEITAESGIEVVSLEKTGSWDIVGFLGRLIRHDASAEAAYRAWLHELAPMK